MGCGLGDDHGAERRPASTPEGSARASIGSDEPAEGARDDALDLRAAVRALPPRQQEAVALYYLLDMPVADSAAAMGCDEGTVKSHLARARATLFERMKEPDPDNVSSRSPHGR